MMKSVAEIKINIQKMLETVKDNNTDSIDHPLVKMRAHLISSIESSLEDEFISDTDLVRLEGITEKLLKGSVILDSRLNKC